MIYLYGADAKKIQTYISESSKLQEIAGASELVEYVCTELFTDFTRDCADDIDVVIAAAGKIRAVVKSRAAAEKIMRGFPKLVAETADGMQLVQGIIELNEEEIRKKDSDMLERILGMELPMQSPYKDWSVVDKSPRSGRPVYSYKDGKLDIAADQKRRAVDMHWRNLRKALDVQSFPSDFAKIANKNSFIAVIHADGNSLGKKLMQLPEGNEYGKRWKEFSRELDSATVTAARNAYNSVIKTRYNGKFRPIILGGDDLTVVCSADAAMDFTREYLENFRAETGQRPALGELSACAGIAFIKYNYPFHFGLELAERLCDEAKKRAKTLSPDKVPSCLMFTLELGSFADADFSALKKRRLTAGEVELDFGPYATDDFKGMPSVNDLQIAAAA